MTKGMQSCVLVLFAALACLGQPALGAGGEPATAGKPAKVLFLDSFEALKTDNGVLFTQPSAGGPIAGAINGTARLVEGKEGRALQLSGGGYVVYPNFNALNLLGGEVSFWVKLNFDPNAVNEANKTFLRNQVFLDFAASDGSEFVLFYTSLNDLALTIRGPGRSVVLDSRPPMKWKQGEWRQLKVSWGNALEVWVDGEKKWATPWDGLFGPVLVDKEKLRLGVGHADPSNIHSEFTMDELTVLSSRPGDLACRPRISLPLLEGAPALDGKLDDPFWQKAGKATGFVEYNRRVLVREQPALLAAYTAEGIYLGVRIPMPDGRPPKAVLTAHNASIYMEDAFEVFLQPSLSSQACRQFVASAIGTELELQHTEQGEVERSFNPEWQVATSSTGGEWTEEAFIPFKALGLAGPPKAGEVWGGNFMVDSATGFSARRTWAFAGGDVVKPMTFGELLFTGNARTLREDSFAGFSEGNPTVRFDLVGDFPPVIRVKSEIFDNHGKPVAEKTFRMSDSRSAVLGEQYLQAGVYTDRLSAVDEAGTEFFRQNVLFQVEKAFTLVVKNYPYAGVAEATAGMGALESKAARVNFKLLSSAGQSLASQSVDHFQRGAATAKIETADLGSGDYTVEAAVVDTQGKPIAESIQQGLKIFPNPVWWKNNLGMDHSVPPPWTPVKATEKGFGVWGRDYQFGDSVFPRQIVSQGKPLFNGTPRVILRADGKELDLVALPDRAAKQELGDQVELTAATDVGGVSARLKGTLEFDGCYRFDLELSPNGAKSVDSLVLELPISREVAQFLLTGNGPNASVVELKSDFKSAFLSSLWLGNDDMGLAVFSESDQYWRPRDAEAIQISLSQDTAMLRFNVLRAPLALKGPISYSFGLMASPVRPIVEGDPFLLGIPYIEPDEVAFPEFLSYPALGLAKPDEGTLEFWTRRTKAGTDAVELFSLVASGVNAGVIQCNAGSGISVDVNHARLLAANVNLSSEDFSHIALTWDSKSVSFYINGRRAATAEPGEAFRKVIEGAAGHEGQLRFGCGNEYLGFTAIEVDEIRISGKARYQGESFMPPDGPFQKDADTRLLDPLDETFVPDGQDALTAAGGQPSLGCRFVPGKFGRALRIEVAPPHPAAELIKAANTTFTFYWNWVHGVGPVGPESYWPPEMFGPVSPDFKKAIETAHRRGLKIFPYTGYPAIGAPSALADQFASEWEVLPVDILPYPPPEGHYDINCSLSARGFADYLAAGAARLMDLGSDGILNDGLTRMWSSENLYARSGYVDEDGALRPTVPVFAWREGMKRLYRIVKARRPDGTVINHSSFDMMLPAMSFSDIYYTGEHEDYENLVNARIRFSSKPWGLQVALLGSSSHAYSSVHAMIELLLGDSQFGHSMLGYDGYARKWMNLRKAYLAFGYKSAEWVPFFRNRDTYYTVEDPKTQGSLYYHPGKDAFLIVGNLEAQDRTVNLKVHLGAFGLEGASLNVRNALTQVPVALTQDGRLNVFVRAKSFVLVAVERNP